MPASKLRIYKNGTLDKEYDVDTTFGLQFELTNTVKGDRFYNVKILYPWDAAKGEHNKDKPSGMQLN